jgi:hypothetical protein
LTVAGQDERGSPDAREPDGPPPLLDSWRNLYVLVLAELGALVLLFVLLRAWASA